MTARLRAWLIALVREAIRAEFPVATELPKLTEPPFVSFGSEHKASPEYFPGVTKETLVTEPSFEQMQYAALQEQEKFYAQPK